MKHKDDWMLYAAIALLAIADVLFAIVVFR